MDDEIYVGFSCSENKVEVLLSCGTNPCDILNLSLRELIELSFQNPSSLTTLVMLQRGISLPIRSVDNIHLFFARTIDPPGAEAEISATLNGIPDWSESVQKIAKRAFWNKKNKI